MTVFRSIHHPDDTPTALVYGQALIVPLAFCTVPVMIAATASALQQQPLFPFLTWGLPAALVAAILWTRFQLGATPAEVRIRDREAAVRSVHDCLQSSPPTHWMWIHDIRAGTDALIVTMGFETHRFRYDTWPDHHALLDALQTARTVAPSRRSPSAPSHA